MAIGAVVGLLEPTASALSLPSCNSGSTNAIGTNEAWMRPPSRSAMMVALTVGHVDDIDAGLEREISAGQMGRGADAGRAVIDRAGLRLRQRDELLKIRNSERRRNHD